MSLNKVFVGMINKLSKEGELLSFEFKLEDM